MHSCGISTRQPDNILKMNDIVKESSNWIWAKPTVLWLTLHTDTQSKRLLTVAQREMTDSNNTCCTVPLHFNHPNKDLNRPASKGRMKLIHNHNGTYDLTLSQLYQYWHVYKNTRWQKMTVQKSQRWVWCYTSFISKDYFQLFNLLQYRS